MTDKPFLNTFPLHIDERGSVYCSLDENGEHDVPLIKRTYVVHNWSAGQIRAWHLHKTGWTGLHVINGAAICVAYKKGPDAHGYNESFRRVLAYQNPGVLWVPPGWANGTKSLVDNTRILVYSTLSFLEVQDDDERLSLLDTERDRFFGVTTR